MPCSLVNSPSLLATFYLLVLHPSNLIHGGREMTEGGGSGRADGGGGIGRPCTSPRDAVGSWVNTVLTVSFVREVIIFSLGTVPSRWCVWRHVFPLAVMAPRHCGSGHPTLCTRRAPPPLVRLLMRLRGTSIYTGVGSGRGLLVSQQEEPGGRVAASVPLCLETALAAAERGMAMAEVTATDAQAQLASKALVLPCFLVFCDDAPQL